MSPFWILLKLRVMEVVGDNRSCKSCKSPVKSSAPTNQHPVFTGRMLFLSPNQQRQSTEGKRLLPILTSVIPASVSSSNSRCVPSRRSSNRSVMLGRPESADSRLFIHLVNVFFCTICWLSAAAAHTHTHRRSQCLTTHSIHRLTLHRFYFSVPYTL